MHPNQKITHKDFPFKIELQVRDYECDLQGIVNNATYQNYLEHTRHEFLKSRGYDFAAITQEDIHLVITHAELHYLKPLRSNDIFTVTLETHLASPLRLIFTQTIYHNTKKTCLLKAKLTATALNEEGKPFPSPILKALTTELNK